MRRANSAKAEILNIDPADHVAGAETAAVTVMAYCDFGCPFCGRAVAVIKRLRTTFGDRLRYVFRHFPLTDKQPFAQQAAELAEAAGAQGRFWPMHDFLFTYQEALQCEDLYAYAEQIGADVDRLKKDVARRLYADRVQRDKESGAQLGVTGTPTLFINHSRVRRMDEDALEQVLRRAA
jgi:formate-nitrite transporter family protein